MIDMLETVRSALEFELHATARKTSAYCPQATSCDPGLRSVGRSASIHQLAFLYRDSILQKAHSSPAIHAGSVGRVRPIGDLCNSETVKVHPAKRQKAIAKTLPAGFEPAHLTVIDNR